VCLELAHAAGLVGTVVHEDASVLVPSEEYDAWLAAEPASRLGTLLRVWPALPNAPVGSPASDGPAAGVLLMDLSRAPDARTELLCAAADLPAGTGAAGADSLAAALRWRAPVAAHDADPARLWSEAHLLGLLAHGALSPLGRALLDGDPAALTTAAVELLPEPARRAVFQADLTAVVPGLADPPLAALLDSAADREGSGGATTWRFGEASVRRALDVGETADGLLAALREAADGALPQPLEYLIGDVARRHGGVRVRAVSCVVHAAPALIAEIAAARALSALGLTVLAPTVLASARPAEETLTALRSAGYVPVGEDADGLPRLERTAPRRAPARRVAASTAPFAAPAPWRRGGAGPAAEPYELAKDLLGRPGGDASEALAEVVPLRPRRDGEPAGRAHLRLVSQPDPGAGAVADAVALHAAHLDGAQQRLLAEAIEAGTPILVDYTTAAGTPSRRVIEPAELDRHLLTAWCHLRDEERVFALDRIDGVWPA
jgi:hypothetical protein